MGKKILSGRKLDNIFKENFCLIEENGFKAVYVQAPKLLRGKRNGVLSKHHKNSVNK
jgi:hypothetical protein